MIKGGHDTEKEYYSEYCVPFKVYIFEANSSPYIVQKYNFAIQFLKCCTMQCTVGNNYIIRLSSPKTSG
jgi:hypothetical protein